VPWALPPLTVRRTFGTPTLCRAPRGAHPAEPSGRSGEGWGGAGSKVDTGTSLRASWKVGPRATLRAKTRGAGWRAAPG